MTFLKKVRSRHFKQPLEIYKSVPANLGYHIHHMDLFRLCNTKNVFELTSKRYYFYCGIFYSRNFTVKFFVVDLNQYRFMVGSSSIKFLVKRLLSLGYCRRTILVSVLERPVNVRLIAVGLFGGRFLL